MRFAMMVLCTAWVTLLGIAPSHAEKRVALVIGNARYGNLPPDQQLRNPVNDARAVGAALTTLGFDVIAGENLGRQEMVVKLDELTRRLSPGDVAFFFFSGHGVAIGGGNFILPSDVPRADSGQETLLARASLGENDIVADLQGRGVRVAVVVLDACRDNPFRRPGGKSVGGEKGFVRSDTVRGVFSLYAAGIGQTALDRLGNADTNPNSVFTRVLVPALTRPGLDLGGLAVEVREEVAKLAGDFGHDQRPAYYDETIGGRVYLAGLPPKVERPEPVVIAPAVDPAEQAWRAVLNSTSIAVLEEFRRQHPGSRFDKFALVRIDELRKSQTAVVVPPVIPVRPDHPALGPCGGATLVSLTSRTAGPLSAGEECALRLKAVFRECAQCPEMVVVPAGSFTMGSPAGEKDRSGDEGPQHRVTFDRQFAAGRFAVTFDEWDACVVGGGCNGYRPADEGWGRGRRPVINVSWNDAQAYVAWISQTTGRTYRLLSEAEREYVARAGTTAPFWWGSSISPRQANYDGTYTYGGGPKGGNRNRTVQVDSFDPNPWGLYQVHGNVWEWTEDCYRESYDGASTDGSAMTTGDCSRRFLRGGSWFSIPGALRAAGHARNAPTARISDSGFRLGRTLTP